MRSFASHPARDRHSLGSDDIKRGLETPTAQRKCHFSRRLVGSIELISRAPAQALYVASCGT